VSNSIPVVSSLVDWGWNVAKRIITRNEEQASLSRESSTNSQLIETRPGPRNTVDDPPPLPRPDHNEGIYDSPQSNTSNFVNLGHFEHSFAENNFELEGLVNQPPRSSTRRNVSRSQYDRNSGNILTSDIDLARRGSGIKIERKADTLEDDDISMSEPFST
jgi:hypothetical protein